MRAFRHSRVVGTAGSRPTRASPPEPRRLRTMREAFERALELADSYLVTGHYSFAGRPVRVRAVGNGFAERTQRAFAHLRVPETTDDRFEIALWDETATGIHVLDDSAKADLDRQWLACGGVLSATADGRYVSFRYGDSVTILDRRANRMIGCRRNGSFLSGGEYSKPLLLMLGIWYHDRGIRLLHAGLIASNGQAVVLPGESGTGKSTTSIAAVSGGLAFLGDDFIGIEPTEDGRFIGHSVYSTACIVRENLGRFPQLQAHAVEAESDVEEKPILFLSEVFPDRIPRTAPITAVALLRIGYEKTRVVPARPVEAMRAFAASSLHTVVPRPGRDALEMLGKMAETLPASWILLGPDPADVPGAVTQLTVRN